ncbi:hypothetical protein HHK36_009116 [Tetracentron sinense]|uniref:Tf2-1-like SH3-like domain-containing protein n=1 Tax=Tetracentron sinense TaxID=13715 RepID=A0A834ZB64_TETSI|nr:hypothetical protein HHK36_009116 [Tetracentron sinense]
MGSTVDLFIRKELSLRGFDDEMRTVVAINLEGRGIKLCPGTNLSELIKTEDGIRVLTGHGFELMAIVVLFATDCASWYQSFGGCCVRDLLHLFMAPRCGRGRGTTVVDPLDVVAQGEISALRRQVEALTQRLAQMENPVHDDGDDELEDEFENPFHDCAPRSYCILFVPITVLSSCGCFENNCCENRKGFSQFIPELGRFNRSRATVWSDEDEHFYNQPLDPLCCLLKWDNISIRRQVEALTNAYEQDENTKSMMMAMHELEDDYENSFRAALREVSHMNGIYRRKNSSHKDKHFLIGVGEDVDEDDLDDGAECDVYQDDEGAIIHGDVGEALVLRKREYNKLSERKIRPCEVLAKFNDNAYRLKFPSHISTSNVKHLSPYHGDTSEDELNGNSRSCFLTHGETYAALIAIDFLIKRDRMKQSRMQRTQGLGRQSFPFSLLSDLPSFLQLKRNTYCSLYVEEAIRLYNRGKVIPKMLVPREVAVGLGALTYLFAITIQGTVNRFLFNSFESDGKPRIGGSSGCCLSTWQFYRILISGLGPIRAVIPMAVEPTVGLALSLQPVFVSLLKASIVSIFH